MLHKMFILHLFTILLLINTSFITIVLYQHDLHILTFYLHTSSSISDHPFGITFLLEDNPFVVSLMKVC